MNQILIFVKEYWQLISAVLLFIGSVITYFLRRKKVVNELDNILLRVFEKLPEFIVAAESIIGAEAKKALVIESVKSFVKNQFSVILPDSYIGFIGQAVEAILATPQKKEVI